MTVIGLDFGNTRSFTSFVQGNDPVTRLGGVCRDLLPEQQVLGGGIPSVFFYSKRHGELVGADALKARPAANCCRLLKRHLNESFSVDGVTFQYDDAIKKVAEYCLRMAMKELRDQYHLTTRNVSLAYPVCYNPEQRRHLVELISSITIDGEPIRVTGTITEPAAAALDYLAEHGGAAQETTVLAFDLGGGTFDLSVVTVYPNGKQRGNGENYYYDLKCQNGKELGGEEFDRKLREIMIGKMGEQPVGAVADMLPKAVESAKLYLSDHESVEPDLMDRDGNYYDFTVTQAEFEQAARELVEQMVEMTGDTLREHPQVSLILLTGGASQMPMIRKALEEAFPRYKDTIIFHRPSRAISYGAARYGAHEDSVQQRTIRDLGIALMKTDENNRRFIRVMIPAGTGIPCACRTEGGFPEGASHAVTSVYEARVLNPDIHSIEKDFRFLMTAELDCGGRDLHNRKIDNLLSIDKYNLLTVKARSREYPDIESTCHMQYDHLEAVERGDGEHG